MDASRLPEEGRNSSATSISQPEAQQAAQLQASRVIRGADRTSFVVPDAAGRIRVTWRSIDRERTQIEVTADGSVLESCTSFVAAPVEQAVTQQRLQLLALEARKEQLLQQLSEVQAMQQSAGSALLRNLRRKDEGYADVTPLLEGIRCRDGRCGIR